MRRALIFGLVLGCFVVRNAWSAGIPPSSTARIGQISEDLYSELKSFVCDERIQRFAGTLDGGDAQLLDAITASLSFENGAEQYSAIRQNATPLRTMADLSGAWSQGEYGSLLHQTAQLMQIEPVAFSRTEEWSGESADVYGFDVSADDSPWDLVVQSREYRLPFHTEIWVSTLTGKVVRVRRTAFHLPVKLRISGIEWTVSLSPITVNGSQWLLPAAAEYSVFYGNKDRREWNLISFSNYRRYGSESALHFEGE